MANMTFKASLLPSSDFGYSLGSNTQKWNIYGNLTGNASTASALNTFASIGSSSTAHDTALKNYFTSNYSSIPRNKTICFYDASGGNGSLALGYFLSGYDSNPYGGFFVAHYNTPYYVGIQNGTYTNQTILTSSNYTSYTIKKDGTGASGTWGISITGNAATSSSCTGNAATSSSCTGNAATATKLQTARKINGTDFDGTADITTANWGTTRTLTIGNKGQSVNGSQNITWNLQDILIRAGNEFNFTADGISAIHFNHKTQSGTAATTKITNYYFKDGQGNTTGVTLNAANFSGNAASASKWATARTLTIGETGKEVDGTANVSWGKAEILGKSDTTKFYRGDQSWSNELTDNLKVKTLTITDTNVNEHLKFSRNGYNYITIPNETTAYLAFGQGANSTSTLVRLTSTAWQPERTNVISLGVSGTRWSKLYVGTADTYGSNTQPIYWKAGVPKAITYTANRLYYPSTTTAFTAGTHFVSDTKIAINSTNNPNETLYVNGNTKIADALSISADIDTNYKLYVNGDTKISSKLSINTDIDTNYNLKVNGKTLIDSTTVSSSTNQSSQLIVSNSNSGNVALELWRNANASWQLANESGVLYLRNNYTTSKQSSYTQDSLIIDYNTGNTAISGSLSVGRTTRSTGAQLYVNGTSYHNGSDTHAGNINPEGNNTRSLGVSGTRWKSLFVGTADSYGAADRPIYWKAGVPTTTTYRMSGTNAKATTAIAITEDLETGNWYVNGTNSTDLYSQDDGVAYVEKYSNKWIHEIYGDYRTGQIAVRGKNNGTWQAWRKVLDTGNYASLIDDRYVNVTGDTMTGPLTMDMADSQLIVPYNGTNYGVLHNHNNGNYSLNACSGGLYMGYSNTTHMDWLSNIMALYNDGRVYLKGQYMQHDDAVASESWINGRNSAAVRVAKWNNYHAGLSMKTANGSWEIGVYTNNNLWFNYATDTNYNAGTNTITQCHIDSNAHVWGAVWNDYAEMRNVPIANDYLADGTHSKLAGHCVYELGDDTMALTTERLQRGCKVISDTFGFNIGETEDCKTPIAVSGRALVYLYESREEAKTHIGWPVCSGPNGTVSIMTEEEEEKYPSRIVGTISAVPDYDEWGTGKVKVNGRIWIYVK